MDRDVIFAAAMSPWLETVTPHRLGVQGRDAGVLMHAVEHAGMATSFFCDELKARRSIRRSPALRDAYLTWYAIEFAERYDAPSLGRAPTLELLHLAAATTGATGIDALVPGDGTRRLAVLSRILHDAARRAGVRKLPDPVSLVLDVLAATVAASHAVRRAGEMGIIPAAPE